MTFVILVEINLSKGFFVYHINYVPELLKEYPKYFFFQDMLKSSVRYNISFFLSSMINDGWRIVGQSQSNNSLFYTLSLPNDQESSSGEFVPEPSFSIGSEDKI